MSDPMDGFSEELQTGLSPVPGSEGRFTEQTRAELQKTLRDMGAARFLAEVEAHWLPCLRG